ncbi:hypothetical protein JCM10213_007162 [Rhodosporidiobolus nylandii]
MRHGRKANAIMNSPIVRSFVKPVRSVVPSPSPSSAPPSSTAANPYLAHLDEHEQHTSADNEDKREEGPWMIPTQPLSTGPPGSSSDVKGKKRAREDEEEAGEGIEAYDAVNGTRYGVKVRYTADELPEELEKYWAQRYRLFSLFDEGCEMDREGWYSVTPENIAAQIAERCRCGTIVDAFCGVGGNAIQFAFTCEKVIALDTSPVRLACARRNAEIYGVADRITFVLADWVQWTRDYVARDNRGEVEEEDRVEVVFLSPPWGGIDYQSAGSTAPPPAKKSRLSILSASTPVPSTPTPAVPPRAEAYDPAAPPPAYPLSALAPLHGAELFSLARQLTHNVAYYLPRNVDLLELAELPQVAPWKGRTRAENAKERVEIEEAWMGYKLKAITAYYGELAADAGWAGEADGVGE